MPTLKEIPAVVGPTACGKTELVLRLARCFHIEIVSCDSRKVFRGADIGAAKPTADEQAQARFHLMDLVEPNEEYSVQQYVSAAREVIADILSRGRIPLIEGGTGLYLEALMHGYDFRRTPPLPSLRTLMSQAWERSKGAFEESLLRAFPDCGESVDMQNRPRVMRYVERVLVAEQAEDEAMRALELLGMSGAASDILRARARIPLKSPRQPMPVHGFALYVEREALAQRIARRAEIMLNAGLVNEVQTLIEKGVPEDAQVFTGIGYRETLMMLQGKISAKELAPLITLRTRQFAKRQDTWNRNRFDSFTRLDYTTEQEQEAAYAEVAKWIEANLA